MKLLFALLAVILYLTALPAANSQQIGVSPPIIDAGEIERGGSRIITFHIITPSKEDLVVRLEASPGTTDFFNRQEYVYMLKNYSEEDAAGWINFLNNPVTLEYEGGGTEGGADRWRRVNAILSVPANAEPGYHMILVRPYPYRLGAKGTAVNILAITSVTILFKVPGQAIRQGRILDITNGNFNGKRLEIRTVFQNAGTVTMTSRGDQINVYDENGSLIHSLPASIDTAKPGDIIKLTTYIDTSGMAIGEYGVDSKVSYITDYDYKRSSIFVGEPTGTVTERVAAQTLPLELLFVPIIIIISYIIYRRGRGQ